jgi:hypothetical protein
MRCKYIWILMSVVLALAGVAVMVSAGDPDNPPGPPDMTTSYRLEDVYNRLSTGATGAQITFTEPISGPMVATGHTIDEIMAVAPQMDDANGAGHTDVLAGKTFWGLTSGEWGLTSGTYPPAPVPKTGQTTSHYTGDDGALEKGVVWPNPRFTNNYNGTITDNLTGLIWLAYANCTQFFGGDFTDQNSRNWTNALIAANSLAAGYCGLTDGSSAGDWRLPNVRELFSLIDFNHPYPSPTYPALPIGHPFTGVLAASDYYWSSTTLRYNSTIAWHINFLNGLTQGWDKTIGYGVWPVRGGQ